VQTTATLSELLAEWLAADMKLYPASLKQVTHAGHFEAFAETTRKGDTRTPLERLVADDGPTEYVRGRLQAVLRRTITKEISTLNRFLGWCEQHGHITDVPRRPKWPNKSVGVRAGTQRAEPVYVTHDEVLRIIAAMPERCGRGGARNVPARDIATFSYFTGLRPSTIARLSVPEHYVPGEGRLYIPPEIDKGKGKARWVPLAAEAVAVLTRHAPKGHRGLIFGRHDLRVQWKRAAAAVLPEERARDFAPYDLRHGAARRMLAVSGGNLLGTAHMLGHTQLTTTNQYLRPHEEHAAGIVEAMNSVSKPVSKRTIRNRSPQKTQ
jgi:integrase